MVEPYQALSMPASMSQKMHFCLNSKQLTRMYSLRMPSFFTSGSASIKRELESAYSVDASFCVDGFDFC